MAEAAYPGRGDQSAVAQAQRETHWRRILGRWKASGLPKTVFCAREGINPPSLHRWVRELERRDGGVPRGAPSQRRREEAVPKFIPVKVTLPVGSAAPIEIRVGEHWVRVAPGFDAVTLRQVVDLLSRPDTGHSGVPRC